MILFIYLVGDFKMKIIDAVYIVQFIIMYYLSVYQAFAFKGSPTVPDVNLQNVYNSTSSNLSSTKP